MGKNGWQKINEDMKKYLAYLRTRTFRRNLIAALISLLALVLIIFFSLRFYTRHGETLPVPELKGMVIDDAVKLLRSQSFEYELDSVYQMDETPGLVIDQDPAPATPVKKNRTLYLTIITRTAPDTPFPDLIEKTFIESRAILNSYGLKLGDTTYTADIARDVVLDARFGGQPINPGRNIPKGSTVDLVLGDGRGANQVDVPNLNGLTLQEVRFALRGASLSLGAVRYQGTITDSLKAVVVEQSPAPGGEKISIGAPVNLSLANPSRH